MRDVVKWIGAISVMVCALLLCYGLFLQIPYNAVVFETNDIGDYGKYVGNHDNDTPNNFIDSFFPSNISNSYTDVQYHYKAKKFDTYAYETYLEFVIPDTVSFTLFLDEHISTNQCKPFAFDQSFTEYSISNVMRMGQSQNESGGYPISYAEVGKILFSVDEQRIIFVALGVYDGGGTDTAELDYFFSRFDIDCNLYQQYAYFTHEDQEKGILFKDR